MRDAWFGGLRAAPVEPGDRGRFDAELDEHHWLGHRMVGETMRYVATDADGVWVALVGFGSAALSCRPRDCFVGWSPEIQFRRLRFVASNQRFCVLPAGGRPNAASAVMARTLRRLSSDWVGVWGHPVLLVETFVDPVRHVGTCYGASSFQLVGQTAGYGRRSGRYVAHGRVKDVYVKALHRRARQALAGEFDHPLPLADPKSQVARIDSNTADLSSLVDRLGQLADPRDARGLRQPAWPCGPRSGRRPRPGARPQGTAGGRAATSPMAGSRTCMTELLGSEERQQVGLAPAWADHGQLRAREAVRRHGTGVACVVVVAGVAPRSRKPG